MRWKMMTKRYVPQVNEAYVPEDGAWAELSEENVLILSMPEWKEELDWNADGYEFAWLYDHGADAYLFCFRLPDKTEWAIVFPKDHAGQLLRDGRAYESFCLLLLAGEIKDLEQNQTRMMLLRDISLKRHPQAGW
ncbi:hypothetical protein [Mechercharimyces sp. CAU 1602]|uniref:hypothetical protein n=1 Tax=Mechercharimyces sp. CAU 1602 TaxID=2973933 RepID=UPI002161E6AD|nr:hypothetical protein [Mechercharimyces sp. CAU 1602]MCS1352170.1 hypothetical protein [Mechercharimyces sp. CAU 1602]